MLVSRIVFACYDASCRPPTSGGTGGSRKGTAHPNTIAGAGRMLYKTKASEKRYGPIVAAIDRIHGLPDDDYMKTNVVVGSATRKGGHFDPYNRKIGPRGSKYYRGTAEIRINNRKDGTEEFSFVHEYGHRTDWVRDPHEQGGGRLVSLTTHKESPEVREAFETLWTAANSPHFKETIRNLAGHDAYKQYYAGLAEVWARAYSQWASGKIGGATRKAFYATQEKDPKYQWPSDEFDATIGPAVEGVLRARGLML